MLLLFLACNGVWDEDDDVGGVVWGLAVVSDDAALVVSRQLLQTFAQELGRFDPESQKDVALYALAQIQPRVVSFEEQVLSLLQELENLYYTCPC